jgi:hypothetical protein
MVHIVFCPVTATECASRAYRLNLHIVLSNESVDFLVKSAFTFFIDDFFERVGAFCGLGGSCSSSGRSLMDKKLCNDSLLGDGVLTADDDFVIVVGVAETSN